MNHKLEVATVNLALDEIIINYGTPFQEEMAFFLCICYHLRSCSKNTVKKSSRNVKLPAHLHVLPWLKMRRTLPPLPFTSFFLDVHVQVQLSLYLSIHIFIRFSSVVP